MLVCATDAVLTPPISPDSRRERAMSPDARRCDAPLSRPSGILAFRCLENRGLTDNNEQCCALKWPEVERAVNWDPLKGEETDPSIVAGGDRVGGYERPQIGFESSND
jgi:hypothetical protein